jgi:hypothetical protein
LISLMLRFNYACLGFVIWFDLLDHALCLIWFWICCMFVFLR